MIGSLWAHHKRKRAAPRWTARTKTASQDAISFVVSAPDSGLDADGVKSHVRAHLARHKIPRDVVFVKRLPRNETGKVLRRHLTGK